jgi:hypothetical protein
MTHIYPGTKTYDTATVVSPLTPVFSPSFESSSLASLSQTATRKLAMISSLQLLCREVSYVEGSGVWRLLQLPHPLSFRRGIPQNQTPDLSRKANHQSRLSRCMWLTWSCLPRIRLPRSRLRRFHLQTLYESPQQARISEHQLLAYPVFWACLKSVNLPHGLLYIRMRK